MMDAYSDSSGDRGGVRKPTKAYYKYVEESDGATTKVCA
jgi:hypothetical protein